ncbi:hypothetical protein F4777DRAFT_429640 [Nemania sp. FL0916]|nr:hypothetical protein F4777DRAFT_429640 [Nemania sp. FL0916]
MPACQSYIPASYLPLPLRTHTHYHTTRGVVQHPLELGVEHYFVSAPIRVSQRLAPCIVQSHTALAGNWTVNWGKTRTKQEGCPLQSHVTRLHVVRTIVTVLLYAIEPYNTKGHPVPIQCFTSAQVYYLPTFLLPRLVRLSTHPHRHLSIHLALLSILHILLSLIISSFTNSYIGCCLSVPLLLHHLQSAALNSTPTSEPCLRDF